MSRERADRLRLAPDVTQPPNVDHGASACKGEDRDEPHGIPRPGDGVDDALALVAELALLSLVQDHDQVLLAIRAELEDGDLASTQKISLASS